MRHVLLALLLLILLLVLAYEFPLYSVLNYIASLFEPDIMGIPDCDTGNDWLIHMPYVGRSIMRAIGVLLCAPYYS